MSVFQRNTVSIFRVLQTLPPLSEDGGGLFMNRCSVTFQKTSALNDCTCPLQVSWDSPSPWCYCMTVTNLCNGNVPSLKMMRSINYIMCPMNFFSSCSWTLPEILW